MGKNKAQRTKSNVKPSNSSRSAELLSKATSNFVGFSVVKDGDHASVLPGLSTNSHNEVGIDLINSNFQLIIKKISKKDATTKFKALQEFITLCNDSSLSSVKAIIPLWPRLYCILAVDSEHRVREVAQLAHGALVKRVGKSIAAHLKQLAGHWFTSQFDTYPPVASAAIKSFQETFPEKKYVDAIIYCQNEILSYIYDIINLQTSQSDEAEKLRYNTSDLLETKHQRILISCLQGYCFYLKNVPSEQIDRTIEIHKQIIGSKNYWKFAEHELPLIKTAFFNILILIIENATDLLEDNKQKTITTVINNIDQTDLGVVAAVWESMLTIMNKYDDWYSIVSIEKLILPKLWRVLKKGGQGCANIIYPALLPLSNQFTKLNFDNKIFFINLLNNIRQGLNLKNVQTSRFEITIITKSFVECLRYAVLLNSNDVDFCRKLVKEQLMQAIESYITEYLSKKAEFFDEVSDLVRYWSKNRESKVSTYYIELVNTFWDELEVIFQRLIINTSNNDYKLPLNIHEVGIKLLISLQNPGYSLRKNTHVKFEDVNNSPSQPNQIETLAYHEDDLFYCELRNFINKLCIRYLDEMIRNTSTVHISVLTHIIFHFNSESLFKAIAKAYEYKNFIEFYNNILKPHLTEKNIENASLIEIIFSLIKYMTDEEKDIVLNSLSESNNSKILNNVITCGLMEKNINDKSVKKWLKTSRITEYFHEIIKTFIDDSSEKSCKYLLLQAFKTIDNEFCVSEEAINDVVNVVCNTLINCNNPSQDMIEFFFHLLKLTWHHERLDNAGLRMLKILIQLNITDSFTNDSKDFLRESWKNELKYIHEKFSKNKISHIQESCMQKIYEIIFSSDKFNENTTEVAQNLIECSSGYNYYEAISTLITVNHVGNSFIKNWIPQVRNIIYYAEIVSGNFFTVNPARRLSYDLPFTTFTTVETGELPERMANCLQWSLLNITLLNDFLQKFNSTYTRTELETFLNDNLSDTFIILNDILLIASFGKLYCHYYKFANNYDFISEMHDRLEKQCNELRTLMPMGIWNKIYKEFLDFDICWAEFGSIFSQYLQYYYGNNSHSSVTKLHEIEILKTYLKCEESSLDLIDHINAILSARNLLNNHNNGYEGNCLSIDLLSRLIKNHKNNKEFFLLNHDISSMSWIQFYLPLEVIRLFTKSIMTVPIKLDNKIWDSVMILLASWQTSLNNYKYLYGDFKLQCFTVALSQLFCAIQNVMNDQDSIIIDKLPSELIDEWKNVFVHDIEQGIMIVWMYYGNAFNKKTEHLTHILMLNYLGDAIKSINGNIFLRNNSRLLKISIETGPLINYSLELLLSPFACLQLSAHYILNFSVPAFVEQDKILIKGEKFDYQNLNINFFLNTLLNVQKIINTMLEDFKLCDFISCIVQPHTDSYTYALGYFLIWIDIFKMCENANANLRYQYAEILKNEYFPSLMNNIFKLMPIEIFEDSNIRAPTTRFVKLFEVPPSLNFHDCLSIWKLDHIVCWLYISCLRHLPALTRQWWSTVDSRVTNIVEKITMLYVSPILCREELSDRKLSDFANMQIKIHRVSREVIALYQMDDTQLELNIVIPTNYPLQSVTVKLGQHVDNAINWRNYHMQLSIFLTHQNGSIWEGLMMWKKNLDKKFSGVEECYICFSIFHINTYQIPKLSCHTCRKKFHAPCLYKWFSTSQKSTCPICRNIF